MESAAKNTAVRAASPTAGRASLFMPVPSSTTAKAQHTPNQTAESTLLPAETAPRSFGARRSGAEVTLAAEISASDVTRVLS